MSREIIVKQLFEHFYNKVYRGASFKLDIDRDQVRSLITNFFTTLYKQIDPNSVGVNFLIDYYSFAFEQYVNKTLQRNISLNWIIGKKMVSRWFARKDSWRFYTDNFLREYQINTDELRHTLLDEQPTQDYLQTFASEELEKSRFVDGDSRLYNCTLSTTLFNHRSVICVSCTQRVACKQILSQVNPKLYQNRGYAAKA